MFGNVIRLNPFGVVVLLGLVFFFIYMYMDGSSPTNYDSVSLKKLLAVGLEVAETGGHEVRLKVPDMKVQSKGKTREGANDPLTDADLRSHRVMVQGFLSIFPDLKVISEEKDETQLPKGSWMPMGNTQPLDKLIVDDIKVPISDVTVWIDPLDATQEFTENLVQYVTTMVCVAIQGKPVIGVIHQPFANRTVWAWVGQRVSPNVNIAATAPSKMTIIHSRSHAGQLEELVKKSFEPGEATLVSAGGTGYKVLQVLEGSASAYLHVTNIKRWDICAGNAILRAAGGDMTTLAGEPILYSPQEDVANHNGLLATLHNHKEFVERLKKTT